MKFESTYKPIIRFDYLSLATVLVILLVSLYLMFTFPKPIPLNSAIEKKVEAEQAKTNVVPQLQEKSTQAIEQIKQVQETQIKTEPEKVVNKKEEIEFELDFSGKAIRKIKSYSLPNALTEEGNINCKLNFTIKPDGSVTRIYPVEKSNTRLELNAIYAMRKWNFEPLKKSANQVDQQAVITFLNRGK